MRINTSDPAISIRGIFCKMAKLNCVIILGIVVAAIGWVSGVTEDEKNALRTAVIPMLLACGAEFGITKEEVTAAKQTKDIDALNPCYYACFFRKIGVMDDKGLFDIVSAKNDHRKYIHGEEDLKKLDEIANTCASVNDKTVSDGAKGCERAKLLLKCMKDNKGSFSPLAE